MTIEEFTNAQAALETIKTELAGIGQAITGNTAIARKANAANREFMEKQASLNDKATQLTALCHAHVDAENRENHRIVVEAEKVEAQRKAAEPQPPSELALLRDEVKRLASALQAKG